MNKVHLMGRLVQDPVLRTVKGSKGDVSVVSFCIAVSGKAYKDSEGNRKSDATFVECEAWDAGADTIAKWFKKGKVIVIEDGSLKQDTWTDKETGKKRSQLRVRCNQWSFPVKDSLASQDDAPAEQEEAAPVGADESDPF